MFFPWDVPWKLHSHIPLAEWCVYVRLSLALPVLKTPLNQSKKSNRNAGLFLLHKIFIRRKSETVRADYNSCKSYHVPSSESVPLDFAPDNP